MSPPLTIGITAFAVDDAGERRSELQRAPRVRAASMAKPLLFWAAASVEPFANDQTTWEALARPAVTVSDNGATAELWSRAGEGPLLASIERLTGVTWRTDADGEHEALRLLVTAEEVASVYSAFTRDRGEAARQLRTWMREVPEEQTFGLRDVAAATLGIPPTAVGVKCGWFGGERAHAAVVADVDDAVLGVVVTTTRPPDAATRRACARAAGSTTELVAIHEELAGSSIRRAAGRGLELAGSL